MAATSADPRAVRRLLGRGVVEVIVHDELVGLLERGEPLRMKMGFDPSRPDIHLGHVAGLRKLRQFQDLGHHLVLIVGDWTAQIGDPSGQSATRPMLSPGEVKENAETYLRQFFKVVDRDRTQVVWQSEWFGRFGLADVLQLASRFTISQFLAREDFSKRHSEGKPIAITELLYPLLQAYDSVAVTADVEFGGTDQKFNLLVGRQLQAVHGQRPQQCVIMPILPGTDGVRKMSKSLDNYIAVEESPSQVFGKVMSLPDDLVLTYYELLTDLPDATLVEMRQTMASGSVNPMDLKKGLAEELVTQTHSAADARQAREEFERVFQRREEPTEIPVARYRFEAHAKGGGAAYRLELDGDERPFQRIVAAGIGSDGAPGPTHLPALLHSLGLAPSRTEARRMVRAGAVEVNDVKHADDTVRVGHGMVIRVGKRRWVRLLDESAE